MKAITKLSATLVLLLFAGIAMAQDVIVKTDQTTVMSKVIEITSAEIKYKKWNNQDGPTYSISRSEVTSINYQNGEVENFTNSTNNQQNNSTPQVQYLNSLLSSNMTVSNGRLNLNSREISDYEVENFVDAESYQLYQKGRNQIIIGDVFCYIGGASLVAASITCPLFMDESEAKTSTKKFFYTFLAVGIAVGVPGYCVSISGEKKLSKVAETYNKNHGNAYSLNISPSLLRCDTPQSQGNYGLGLTLNVNF